MATGNFTSNSNIIYAINTYDEFVLSNLEESMKDYIQSEYRDEDFFFTDEEDNGFHSFATIYLCDTVNNGEGYECEFCVNMKVGYRSGYYEGANLDYRITIESIEDSSAEFDTIDALTDDIIKYPETYDLDDGYEFQIKVDKKLNKMVDKLDKFVNRMFEKHADHQLVCDGHMSNGSAVYKEVK